MDEVSSQGRPKGKAAQARALGLPKKIIFLKPIRPQKNLEFDIYRPHVWK
jgi:hypothetical protein